MVVILYGIFCIVGGIIGYVAAQSLASLLWGGIGGLLLIGCGIAMGWSRIATFIALLISFGFGLRFFLGLILAFQVMPHLIMVILSAVSIAACSWQLAAK